jgi:serine phosphatase RsbU (regulator of sigma subunit)
VEPHSSAEPYRALRFVEAAIEVAPGEVVSLLGAVCETLGADAARLYVADYSLRRLQQVDVGGLVGEPQPIEGTWRGRAFTSGNALVSEASPTVVAVPLAEGSSRVGILELDFATWTGELPDALGLVADVLVMAWVTKGRYSDLPPRVRRSEPLSVAAEVQWDLLPPLSCSTREVAVGGILEPAYSIGGDSFDYAVGAEQLELAIVDAIGHGMSAVLMASATINSLRNSRRERLTLSDAYDRVDRLIEASFGSSFYVTGQLATLDLATGVLTWVNAGHVPPMLVRDGSYVGTLSCRPSRPFGLGGPVVEVATERLQRGDRVLFYTDGIIESRSPDGEFFGEDRLADYLVRAALEHVPVNETVRHLSENITGWVRGDLNDDATMLLVEYRGGHRAAVSG